MAPSASKEIGSDYFFAAYCNFGYYMQSRPSIAEFDNLAKRCEFLTEKNLELRSQLSLLQGEIDLLQDDRVVVVHPCSSSSRPTRKWYASSSKLSRGNASPLVSRCPVPPAVPVAPS